MAEDLSPVYDDVQIREWAHNIRQIKINELRERIRKKEQAIRDTDFTKEDYMSPRRIHLLSDISRLKRKLKTITND